MSIRRTSEYRRMDSYEACAIAEGFADYEPSETEKLAAWQFLVDHKIAWKLQGWYGRNADAMLQAGILEKPRV